MQSTKIIALILFINALVFAGWSFSTSFNTVDFFVAHFLVSGDALNDGRYWVLLTSVFSHLHFFHFFINMMVLNSFGPILCMTLGTKKFLGFYLIAGIVASLSHVLVSDLLIGDKSIPALGASGALAGMILLFSLMFPREKLLLLGIIPIKALWGALLFIGIDVWGLIAQGQGGGFNIGHGAHLGGAFVGILYYLVWRRSEFYRRQRRVESV